MKIEQIICALKKGILNETSEILAQSEGLWDEDKSEIEELLKSQGPGSEDEDIPALYGFFVLKSGRHCFFINKKIDIVYGSIYHFLVLDEETFSFYPIQLVDSDVFEVSYEDILVNKTLPVLHGIPLSDTISMDKVTDFVKKKIASGFKEMISCAIDYHENGFPIYITDSNENSLMWIAAVQMSFPVELSHKVTFSSLNINREGFMFHCSSSNYMTAEDISDRYIFDFKKGIRGKPKTALKSFRIIEMGYLSSRKVLDAFHRFLLQFDCKVLNEEIDDCYNLFLLAELKQVNALSNAEIKASLDYAKNYGDADVLDYIYNMIEPTLHGIIKAADFENALSIAGFLFKAALNSPRITILSGAYEFFYTMLDHLMFDYKIEDANIVFYIYNEASLMCGERVSSFYKNCIDEKHIVYITAMLKEKPSLHRAQAALSIVLHSLINLESSWSQALHIKDMPILLDMSLEHICQSHSSMEFVLDIASQNTEYFTRTIMLFYNRIKNPDIMSRMIDKIISILDIKDEDNKIEIRKEIFRLEGSKLLLDEFSERLKKAEDKRAFFEEYRTKVLNSMSAYEKACFSNAVDYFIKSLDKAEAYTESLKFIDGMINSSYDLDDTALLVCLKAFEAQVEIPPSDYIKNLIPEIKRMKKARSIKTYPDITEIIDYALFLQSTEAGNISLDEALEGILGIESLDDKRAEMYMKWCLPYLMKLSREAEDHKKIMHILGKDRQDEQFYKGYMSGIRQIVSNDNGVGAGLLSSFCVYYFFYLEPRYRILEEEELIEIINNKLVETLKEQSASTLREIDGNIKREFENRRLSLPVLWNRLYNEVLNSRDKSIFKNIKGLFK
ncbi:hypothetical protein OXPF_18230 [Oxobacter pfennigii]|uniref:Uncharacterized protein n=1 Tax=Oxobacter pfennigii TaxID=36849 RepID=A0A0P8YY96_9CLOT|nr:hypothetical protein [Oxobacter pfennigii]KPU44737.1 hypothetical protein OXPF_18230 [Oxobacter pfennigii]